MNAEEQAALEARIDELERTHKQLEETIHSSTGKRQDAAIRMLAGCGTALAAARARLR